MPPIIWTSESEDKISGTGTTGTAYAIKRGGNPGSVHFLLRADGHAISSSDDMKGAMYGAQKMEALAVAFNPGPQELDDTDLVIARDGAFDEMARMREAAMQWEIDIYSDDGESALDLRQTCDWLSDTIDDVTREMRQRNMIRPIAT